MGLEMTASIVPPGLSNTDSSTIGPSNELLGYYQPSLRDS